MTDYIDHGRTNMMPHHAERAVIYRGGNDPQYGWLADLHYPDGHVHREWEGGLSKPHITHITRAYAPRAALEFKD